VDIVVGVDNSPAAVTALLAAAEEARLRGATLHVVHVVHIPPSPLADISVIPNNLVESNYELAETVRVAVWEKVKTQLGGSGLQWIQVDRLGYPADEILDYAQTVEAGLIVVGSRGFGDLKSLLLGSTSHRISHLAQCNVLIARNSG
jgi:nucleotide-binding universal stress UspA family protein